MRILCLDVGSSRIGVAISDESCIIAQPLKYIGTGKKDGNVVKNIADICREYDINEIVIGMPLSMSGGNRGLGCRRAEALGSKLQNLTERKIVFVDERFTTTQAERILIEGKVNRKSRKMVVDKIAAAIILQGYLDGLKNNQS